jgi:hypothetical protein
MKKIDNKTDKEIIAEQERIIAKQDVLMDAFGLVPMSKQVLLEIIAEVTESMDKEKLEEQK